VNSISVIVLSHNRPAYLRRAIASVVDQTRPADELIIVDNPSSASQEISAIVADYPAARLVQPSENLGFAGGMNLGIRHTKHNFVFMTEDDIVLDKRCMEQLLQASIHNDGLSFFSPVMYKLESAKPHFSRGTIDASAAFRLRAEAENADNLPLVYPTGYVAGATIFGPRIAFSMLGPFQESFFMYSEDVDFSLRVLRAGGRLWMVRDAKSYHFEPPTDVRPSAKIEFHKVKNRMALHILHDRQRSLPRHIAAQAVGVLCAIASGDLERATASVKALAWFAQNITRLRQDRTRCAVEEQTLRKVFRIDESAV